MFDDGRDLRLIVFRLYIPVCTVHVRACQVAPVRFSAAIGQSKREQTQQVLTGVMSRVAVNCCEAFVDLLWQAKHLELPEPLTVCCERYLDDARSDARLACFAVPE